LLPAGAFAGWGSHPLESAALSRRTQRAVVHRRCGKGQIEAKPRFDPQACPRGITAFIVERGMKGISNRAKLDKL